MTDELSSLSLADLRLLALLLAERSITRAAEASGQAQPAVSRRLQRLRELLGDPLLVRSGTHMVVTERAQSLREPLREILARRHGSTPAARSSIRPGPSAPSTSSARTACRPSCCRR